MIRINNLFFRLKAWFIKAQGIALGYLVNGVAG
jgi:hypothetical protein